MRHLLIGLCIVGCANRAMDEPPPSTHELTAAKRVVLAQVDAYKRHDIDAFVDTYAADVALYMFPDILLARGQDSLRTQYAGRFTAMPNLRAEVAGRLVGGKYVLLDERVTGMPGMDTLKTIVIYEVRDGKISRAWFIQ